MALKDVADAIDNRVLRVREMIVDNDIDESCQIGDGIDKMMKNLKEKPIVGNPLFDPYTNEVVMGARMGCFYIRSAATGVGKLFAVVISNYHLTIGGKIWKPKSNRIR